MLIFFNDTATTEIYTLSLHDALPILLEHREALTEVRLDRARDDLALRVGHEATHRRQLPDLHHVPDRKSTRLNSSHANISYAVFCLKKTSIFLFFHTVPPFTLISAPF